MIFTIEPPKKSGYYWILDTAYVVPYPVYVQNGKFYNHGIETDCDNIYTRRHIRYGDEIVVPDTKTNLIEYTENNFS